MAQTNIRAEEVQDHEPQKESLLAKVQTYFPQPLALSAFLVARHLHKSEAVADAGVRVHSLDHLVVVRRVLDHFVRVVVLAPEIAAAPHALSLAPLAVLLAREFGAVADPSVVQRIVLAVEQVTVEHVHGLEPLVWVITIHAAVLVRRAALHLVLAWHLARAHLVLRHLRNSRSMSRHRTHQSSQTYTEIQAQLHYFEPALP